MVGARGPSVLASKYEAEVAGMDQYYGSGVVLAALQTVCQAPDVTCKYVPPFDKPDSIRCTPGQERLTSIFIKVR